MPPPKTNLKASYYGKGSVEVPGENDSGHGQIRRLAITSDKLISSPQDGIETTADIIDYAARTHGTRDAIGWRDVVRMVEEEKEVSKFVDGKEVKEKKLWKYFQLSDYKYLNYVQLQEAANEIARGLLSLGITKEDVINVYAATSVNWQLMSHGCATISTPIATAYDTLGESGLTHSLNEPSCAGVFTNADLLQTVLNVLPKTPTIKHIIYDGEAKPEVLDKIRAAREGINVFSLDELRKKGRDHPEEALKERRPTKDTLVCIMYTSGSTGAPKGVCITNANLIASVGAIKALLGHHITTEDSYIAYLPLAHILEYIVELYMIYAGTLTGYGRVKTLTDQSVRNCLGDLRAFKPTIMTGVPAVWETIRKGILSKIHGSGAVRKSVFNGAYSVKKSGVPGLAQIADTTIMSSVRAATGGRLKVALSGGAALSKETQEFLSIALVTMIQGYGMTESCGMCAIQPPEITKFGAVGFPVPSIEIKFLDVPEAGYLSSNDPPQGEVCIRGNSVIKEYYKRPDLNSDESIFTKDGWLRTGDVGQWNPDGTLTLIDRIKNLVKLSGGEYIALEHLESVYKSCNLVANLCVHATPDAVKPLAIVIPHEQHLRAALPENLSSLSLSDLVKEKQVNDMILKECNAVGKKNAFKPLELLQAVILTDEEWTPENGMVTAAQKIQRKKVAEKFDDEIKEIYKKQ
jgi:long-chain acyl-CoA synthetase